jgi:hypothetical protein
MTLKKSTSAFLFFIEHERISFGNHVKLTTVIYCRFSSCSTILPCATNYPMVLSLHMNFTWLKEKVEIYHPAAD